MAGREEDREWKDKGRPQSIMAQQFSAALDNVFGLDSGGERSETIEEKKRELTTQNAKLAELEARLKAMEAQLKSKQPGNSSGARHAPNQPGAASSSNQSKSNAMNAAQNRRFNAPTQQRQGRVQGSSESDDDSEDNEEETEDEEEENTETDQESSSEEEEEERKR